MPVLAYHGINDSNDHYSVSQRGFAEQMEMLEPAGLPDDHASTQYVRFLRRATRGLPPRPILITFDDGRLDSYRGADKILAKHGFPAVMFVIAGHVNGGQRRSTSTGRSSSRMQDSGRWDIQEHAGTMHENVPVDQRATRGPRTRTGAGSRGRASRASASGASA